LSGASDKGLVHLPGDHYGNPTENTRGTDPRVAAKRVISRWIGDRF